MTKHKGYLLTFASGFNRERGIDVGRLVLNHIDRGHQSVWKAWSSHVNGQEKEGFHQRGGMLPPAYRCPKLRMWKVKTNPNPMPHVAGVSGNFYKINPHEVVTDRGGHRGDFGIHLDANHPGSLGCIVTDRDRFLDFENTMTRLRAEGVSEIPLIVVYS